MNLQKYLIGGLIMTVIIWVYTNLVVTFVDDIASQISGALMGLPLIMGFFVYIVSDYLNKMFNK